VLYKFEWDPTKAKRNFCGHQVSFERATTIFRDSTMIALFDDEGNTRRAPYEKRI